MKTILLPITIICTIFTSCSSLEIGNNDSLPENSITIIEEPIEHVEEEISSEIQSINEDNKILYDALVPLGSNILPKEMNLSEDGYRLLPRSVIGKKLGFKFTLYADFSININDEHAVIIRVKSFDPNELDVLKEDVQNYLISFDEYWNITDRIEIHKDNSLNSSRLLSSGWQEISRSDSIKTSRINISWQKINLEDGKVIIIDEGAITFEGSEEGILEAQQFTSQLHSSE